MVFTTKHHDGCCMFDSACTDYVPVGFYSSSPDMHHPGFRESNKLTSENSHGQPERPEWQTYLACSRLRELPLANIAVEESEEN
jgi:alpha-L-fucosidase